MNIAKHFLMYLIVAIFACLCRGTRCQNINLDTASLGPRSAWTLFLFLEAFLKKSSRTTQSFLPSHHMNAKKQHCRHSQCCHSRITKAFQAIDFVC
ncbi:hypothetical protein BC830DRAFT_1126654 [Chytriomyces sp. MP71]|nr:hypothetical protein BC830DRAFT_1126654 [Chytriomyces sp. MP71]